MYDTYVCLSIDVQGIADDQSVSASLGSGDNPTSERTRKREKKFFFGMGFVSSAPVCRRILHNSFYHQRKWTDRQIKFLGPGLI